VFSSSNTLYGAAMWLVLQLKADCDMQCSLQLFVLSLTREEYSVRGETVLSTSVRNKMQGDQGGGRGNR
jgi:hypothetical protein